MKGSSALNLAILIFFAFGCMCSGSGNLNSNQKAPSPSPSPTPFIDSPKLVNKSAKEIDAILGKPVEVTKITNDPDDVPGEFRDYKLPGSIVRVTTAGVVVRFYRDKAIHFTIELPREYDTPVEALKSAGIDVNDAVPESKLQWHSGGREFSTASPSRT